MESKKSEGKVTNKGFSRRDFLKAGAAGAAGLRLEFLGLYPFYLWSGKTDQNRRFRK